MTDFRAKIGKITMKNGGAVVHVLDNAMPNYVKDTPENWRGTMLRHAREIAADGDNGDAKIDGFVIAAIWDDGKRSLSYRMSPRIPRELFPSYIAEMIRTDAVTENEAENTFDRKFEWVDS